VIEDLPQREVPTGDRPSALSTFSRQIGTRKAFNLILAGGLPAKGAAGGLFVVASHMEVAMRIAIPVLVLVASGGLALGCDHEITDPVDPSSEADIVASSAVPLTARGRVSGGGQIREDDWRVSFAGQATGQGSHAPTPWSQRRWMSVNPRGQWVIRFHNVSEPQISGATFKSTRIVDFWFSEPANPESDCLASMAITVEGSLDGEPGWMVWFRANDLGSNSASGAEKDIMDTARPVIWAPGGHPDPAQIVYDSDWGDFPRESTCSGQKPTGMDTGNMRIQIWY
jgi:hypothetical protein